MALVKDGALVDDPFLSVQGEEASPSGGPIIVSLAQWQAHREELQGRAAPVGVRLKSDESPELIAADLKYFALVALEFPSFRDGRPYSYARLLRERYGFTGELRAVGDVLLEQLGFMIRTGFNAFELDSEDPLRDFQIAAADLSVWYQPTADGRRTATDLRHQCD